MSFGDSSFPPEHTERNRRAGGKDDGQFLSLHSLDFDSPGRLFVADRGNFPDLDLRSVRGGPGCLVLIQSHQRAVHRPQDVLDAIDSESDDHYNIGWRKGLRIASARTGEVN
jgi:hypothetical protein